MNVQEVEARKAAGYNPQAIYNQNEELHAAINLIATGHFSHGDRELFRPVVNSLLYDDPYMVLADYQAYVDCQQQVGEVFQEPERWTRMAILNVSSHGQVFLGSFHYRVLPKNLARQTFSGDISSSSDCPTTALNFPKRNRIVRT